MVYGDTDKPMRFQGLIGAGEADTLDISWENQVSEQSSPRYGIN
jgi:hypothetical protein